jgi:hypothetical protein
MYKFAAALVLVFSFLIASPARSATPTQNDYFINLNTVKIIRCVDDDGPVSGSGVIIGKDRILTANHVIFEENSCTVDGKQAKLISHDEKLDVALLEVDLGPKPPVVEISCDGYLLDHLYFSLGYAWTQDFAMTKMVATGIFEDAPPSEEYPFSQKHMAKLIGYVYPGMSGGPVFDESGRLVGINNMSEMGRAAFSRSLEDTELCSALRKPKEEFYPKKKITTELGGLKLIFPPGLQFLPPLGAVPAPAAPAALPAN